MELVESAAWVGELTVKKYRLGNGLKVLFLRDPSAPVFACHTWMDVGSRNEREGRTGLAHLFEHLLFKETKNLEDGEFDKLMEERGAATNAATYVDWTYYHQALKTEHLDFVLGLEADRMQNMILSDEQLRTEREVVKNERLLRTENDPEGAMNEAMFETAYTAHSYRWPVIGRKADLDAIDLSDCMAFYSTYYAPNNATLVLVGDLDEKKTMALVQKHYGPLAASKLPELSLPEEPPQRGERRVTLEKPIAADLVLVGYHIPRYTHPDLPALEVLSTVLFDGPSSRVERRLVGDTQLCTRAESWVANTRDPGLWEMLLALREGVPAWKAEALLYEELERVQDEWVEPAELDKAKAKLESGFLRSLRDVDSKAYHLGFHEVTAGDFKVAGQVLDRWRRVSRQDLRDVAGRYLGREGRTVVHAVPQAATRGEKGKAGSSHRELDGGAKLYVEASRELPIVNFRIVLRAGCSADPPGKEGVTSLATGMLFRGTKQKSREAFEEAADRLGASLRCYAGRLTSAWSGDVVERNLPAFVDLLMEALLDPAFDQKELDKLRDDVVAGMREEQNDDDTLVRKHFRAHLFAGHGFALDTRGTLKSLQGLSPEDVRQHYFGRLLNRGNLIVAAAGATGADPLEHLIRPYLPRIPAGARRPVPDGPPPTTGGRRMRIVDKPDRSQVQYVIGHRGVRASDPDWIPLMVADTAFGGCFTSKLMQEIRVRRGWSYGAYSSNARNRVEDMFMMTASPSAEDAPACIKENLRLYEEFCAGKLTPGEIEAAKSYLFNRYPFLLDTAEKRLDRVLEPELLGIDEGYWGTYAERIRSLTPKEVRAAIKRHRQPEHLSIVVLATAKGMEPRLRKAGLHLADVETVSFDADE